MPETQFDALLSRVHSEIVRSLLDRGSAPAVDEMARGLGLSPGEIDTLLHGLSEIHGLVLHPKRTEPWIVHPFSLTPTLNWVQGPKHGWWAPCVWCGFGVAALAGGAVVLHTRIGGEAETIAIDVVDGEPVGSAADLVVHFAIPPARAWDNVHEHCSMVLAFRSAGDIEAWCDRHGLPRGEAVPIAQVAALARTWYGTHADVDWRKWTVAEAQQIFHEGGLRSSFWDLGQRKDRF